MARVITWTAERGRRFKNGFMAPFRAIRYLFEHPKLLGLAVPPSLITAGLLAGALFASFTLSDDVLAFAWSEPIGPQWYVAWLLKPIWYLIWAVIAVVMSMFSVVAVYLASIPLAGPFFERLSEKVETLETGFDPPFDWSVLVRNLAVTAFHVTLFLCIQIVVFALTAAIGFIPVVGQVAAAIISFVMSPLLVGFLPFDYPMTVRLWTFRDKIGFMWKHFSTFFGFSLAAFAMLYIPLLNIALLPACVVAATLLLVELEANGELPAEDKRKSVLLKRQRIVHDHAFGHLEATPSGAETTQTDEDAQGDASDSPADAVEAQGRPAQVVESAVDAPEEVR